MEEIKLIEENNLIEKAKNGDDAAFEVLFNQYKPLVKSICRKYILVGADIDDLHQEGMIGLFSAVKNYNPKYGAAFSTYARVVVENKVINAIKSHNAQKNYFLQSYIALNNQGGIDYNSKDGSERKSSMMPTSSTTLEDKVLGEEGVKSMLSQIKDTLSNYEMEILQLYLEGIGYKDIATKLEVAPKSIDNALGRIKKKLQFLK